MTLLEFLETYDPTKDTLEMMSGLQLQCFKRDSIKCDKKLKRRGKEILLKERIMLHKLNMKKLQEKMITEKKIAKDGFSRESRTNKSLHSSFEDQEEEEDFEMGDKKGSFMISLALKKLIQRMGHFFPSKEGFTRATATIIPDTEDVKKTQTSRFYSTIDLQPDVDLDKNEIRARMKKIKMHREKKMSKKKEYMPSRLHCWVLIRPGSRDIQIPFFIDVLTGCHYSTTDENYLKISCAWNDRNYYIPRYVKSHHGAVS